MVNALSALGDYLARPGAPSLEQVRMDACARNPWHSPEFTAEACKAWAALLQPGLLREWILAYPKAGTTRSQRVGIIMAGNIPLAGMHDLVSVIITGHTALIKPSSKDAILLPHLAGKLIEAEPGLLNRINITGILKEFDAIIATGSDAGATQFGYYFRNVPHIIRRNRNSIAVLTGIEKREALLLLGKDIFTYFGLGCRNVSKLFVPEGYSFEPLLEALEPFSGIIENRKYRNNYDYNRTLFIINKTPHFHNNFLLLTENRALSSPVACLNYEYYSGMDDLSRRISEQIDGIQCITAPPHSFLPGMLPGTRIVEFGKTQHPDLSDYADGTDTVKFLLNLGE